MKKIRKIVLILVFILAILGKNIYAVNIMHTSSVTSSIQQTSQTKTSSQIAKENTPVVDTKLKVYDYAKLLTQEQEKTLYSKAMNFIEMYKMDMVIVTIDKNNKSSSMAYADDFYDYNNFGIGTKKSGLLFLIDMQNRKIWISTTGDAIKIYTDSKINVILDYAYNKIANQDYNGCVEEFIHYTENYAKNAGNYGDNSNEDVSIQDRLTVAGAIAGAGAILFVLIGTATHRKPKIQKEAGNYISSPIKLYQKTDDFIRKDVTKKYNPPSDSSSSGSSTTHTGSSGTTHGGGGRSF